MCPRHDLPVIGTICGEDYCIECSNEYQETLEGKNPDKQRHPGTRKIRGESDGHKMVWIVDDKVIGEENE